jgi:hypothetical protein
MSKMNNYWLAMVAFCWLGGMVARSDGEETSSLLSAPKSAKTNITSSPKFDDRVFVYCAEPVSASILEHDAGNQELSLNVGARDGVRFGHAFQIVEPTSKKWIGVAKVMELGVDRSVAILISLEKEAATSSIKGFTAVCTEPKAKSNETIIECRFGKDVWQTESFENKLIRGLLENCGKNVQIRIRQEDSVHAPDSESHTVE